MKTFFACLLAAALLLAPSAFAQEGADAVTIDKANVKQLIETLESETARKEFITNLKTLMEAEGEKTEEPAAVPFTQSLGIEAQARGVLDRYHAFLARNHLSGSLLGKIALTSAVFLFSALLVAVIKKVSLGLQRRANRVRQKFAIHHDRFRHYTLALRYLGYAGVLGLLAYTLTVIWEADIAFLTGEAAISFFGQVVGVLFIVILAIVIWEVISGSIDYGLKRASEKNAMRMRTLLPIVKSILLMAFAAMFGLVLLSEIGFNVMPLLAGAGIVGVAVGFGAQAMVKDFLTGFTVIFEDLFHVGDVVTIAGISGVVESITLRKVQLRDISGAVHTIPFSEITTIQNSTKDFSYYLFDTSVAYKESMAEVEEALRVVDAKMRSEEAYGELILEPMEIMGVDRFLDSGIIFRSRVKTKPGQQWNVGREYNRRIKEIFEKRGIEIPFPQQVVWNRFEEGMGPLGPLPKESGNG